MNNEGKIIYLDYVGTLDDGSEFISSDYEGVPLRFVCGGGTMIPKFDEACMDMEVGETKHIRLEVDEAYGERDEDFVEKVPFDALPEDIPQMEVGAFFFVQNGGEVTPLKILAIDDEGITFDCNNPLCGEALNFDITIRNIEEIPEMPDFPEPLTMENTPVAHEE